MDNCFKGRQIPCRWVPDLEGFGSPLFNYHGPLPYYFGESIFLLIKNLFFSANIMFAFPLIGSYVLIYFLTNIFLGKLVSALFAFFYSFAPYYALKLNIKEPLGEMWALMFLAASIYSINRLKENISIKNLLLVGISVASLITSYEFSVTFLLSAVLIFTALLFFKRRQVKFLLVSLAGLLLGCLLSSFYLLPMLFEKNLIHSNYLPIHVQELALRSTSRYQILTGDTKVLDFREGSNWMSFKTEANSHTIIRLSQYYFPTWKVFVDGKQIPIDYKNNINGLMTFILGKGNHEIYARLYDTPIRSLSNLITEAAFGITAVLFFLSFSRVRKWILYYRKRIN